jgi:hypothetical protein
MKAIIAFMLLLASCTYSVTLIDSQTSGTESIDEDQVSDPAITAKAEI